MPHVKLVLYHLYIKGKVVLCMPRIQTGVHKCSSTHLYTAVALGEVSDQVHALDDITQGQELVPIE